MPRRRKMQKRTGRKRPAPKKGKGIKKEVKKAYKKVKKFINSDVVKDAKKVNKFLRDNKVISRTASVGEMLGLPGAKAVKTGATKLGYGKGKRAIRV